MTFVQGYKSTVIDLLPKLRVLDRKSISRNTLNFYYFMVSILAISNADRARAYNESHPDRRKILDRIGFSFHIQPKQEENLSKKKLIFSPIISTRIPQVQIQENDQDNKTQELNF